MRFRCIHIYPLHSKFGNVASNTLGVLHTRHLPVVQEVPVLDIKAFLVKTQWFYWHKRESEESITNRAVRPGFEEPPHGPSHHVSHRTARVEMPVIPAAVGC